ncbi:hypothetical protein V6Z12_A12G097200 [Gossypium hirsutum]
MLDGNWEVHQRVVFIYVFVSPLFSWPLGVHLFQVPCLTTRDKLFRFYRTSLRAESGSYRFGEQTRTF